MLFLEGVDLSCFFFWSKVILTFAVISRCSFSVCSALLFFGFAVSTIFSVSCSELSTIPLKSRLSESLIKLMHNAYTQSSSSFISSRSLSTSYSSSDSSLFLLFGAALDSFLGDFPVFAFVANFSK